MRIIRPSSETEMVSEFLKAEIDSGSFAKYVKQSIEAGVVSESEIRNPDISNSIQNNRRARALAYRGYPTNLIFSGLNFDGAQWSVTALNLDELNRVLGLPVGFWLEASDSSRLLKDIAEKIKVGNISGREVDKIKEVKASYDKNLVGTKPIVVKFSNANEIYVLEGHNRITASIINEVEELEVILCTMD